MAITKPSILSDIRGKIGGLGFQKSQGGLIIRKNPSKPVFRVKRASAGFTTWESAWAYCSKLWNTLSANEQYLWNTCYLTTVPRVNAVGNTYYWSGFNAFMNCNCNLLILGIAPIDAPVTPPAVTPIVSITPTMTAAPPYDKFIDYLAATTDVNLYHKIFMSGPYLSSVYIPKNKWKYIGAIAPNANSPFDFKTLFQAAFVRANGDQKWFFRLVPVEMSSGYTYNAIEESCIVS